MLGTRSRLRQTRREGRLLRRARTLFGPSPVSPVKPHHQRDDGATRQHQNYGGIGRETLELCNNSRHVGLTDHQRELQNHAGSDRGRDCKNRLGEPYG
jgi:hypothetical protein